jgi:protein-S-isoprenylcysteine O-methyltransferase
VPPLFESGLEELLFWVVFIGTFLVPLVVFGRWSRQNAASTRSAPRRDVSTFTNFALIPAAIIAIALGYARIGVLPHWLFYPGLALFISGLALTMWAYRTLGRFFSLIVQVQTDHHVVDTGPYRFVRHPGYAGVLLGFLGLGLAMQSWAALLLMALATLAALAYRLRVEEKFLLNELADEYRRYAQRTKRLIPFIW